MDPVSTSVRRNRFLARASVDDRALLQPHLEPVTLALRYELEKPNTRIEIIYFMDAGIASVVAVQKNKTRIEVGLIGCEGMTGTAVVMGDDRSPYATFRPPDLIDFAMTPNRRLSAVLCRETAFRWR